MYTQVYPSLHKYRHLPMSKCSGLKLLPKKCVPSKRPLLGVRGVLASDSPRLGSRGDEGGRRGDEGGNRGEDGGKEGGRRGEGCSSELSIS